MSETNTTPEQDHARATNIIKSVWSILAEAPASIKEHERRAAQLEWLTNRVNKLLELEKPKTNEDSK